MSTILMSIKPVYVDKIFEGVKKYEYRKIMCKNIPDKIIVYATTPIKKVVGELIIEEVLYDKVENIWNKTGMYSGVNKDRFLRYFNNREYAVAYKVKECIKYDTPKNLIDYNIKMAPQSYVYVKEK